MQLYKFINEHEVKLYKQGFVVLNNKIYTNPVTETLFQAGYKEMIEEGQPEYNPETHYLSERYIDGDKITKTWEIKENIIEEETGEVD